MKIKYILILLVIIASANFSGATEIMNIRHWTAPDHSRVVIDVGEEPFFEIQESAGLIVLNFKDGTRSATLPAEIAIEKPGIKKVIIHQVRDGSVKIEFILDKYLKTQIFKLKKFQDKPDRVVVDIFLEQPPSPDIAKRNSVSGKQKKVIVIDPGHGGDDPGAVGKKGTCEKHIVLSISREIKKAINKLPGYSAVLTRDGDYYVSFNKRLQMARDLNASLFISVHADAARNRQARGSSVYCLSTGAASNEAAKLLAKNENLADIIGGVPNGEGKTDSDQIILNMFQTNTINLSKIYAANLMRQLYQVNNLKYQSVQEAPFRVLKLPDVPAVLVETAYLSNVEEEKLLKSKSFQKKLALAVASSAVEYLAGAALGEQNSDATVKTDENRPADQERNDNAALTEYYTVKKGDTLFSIARLFDTQVAVILKLNNRRMEDALFTEQKILVPANRHIQNNKDLSTAGGISNGTGDKKRNFRIYLVKRGYTLFSLAKNNSITIDELRKLNNMKNSDQLLLGQKIRLP